MWRIACVLLALSALVHAQAGSALQKKAGDDVVLSPGPVTGPITSIRWKVGVNLAVQWEAPEPDVTYYRHFKERGSLNTSSGALTIRGLTPNDSNVYTPEINEVSATPTNLRVLAPVPVPTVTASCNEDKSSCTLTCEGDITGVPLVTYKWMSDGVQLAASSKDHRVEKESSLSAKEFYCELDNGVSREGSEPIANPLLPAPPISEWKPNISTGVTVLICLLASVLLLAFLHRWRAGMWFFKKESMPWEADFWRKDERSTRDAAEANGTATRRETGRNDEETPMA